MDFSNNISSNSFGLQNNFINKSGFGMKTSNMAYYAKKGEPMYMKDMDADEDGIVSFDEFKDYCKANGISTKDMIKMVETANSYRTMQTQKKAERNIKEQSGENPASKEIENEAVYARRGDGKYDESMDVNNDDKVSYKEYIEYCKDHAQTKEKSNTKIEESENGEFKISNTAKSINAYTQTEPAESFIDEEG